MDIKNKKGAIMWQILIPLIIVLAVGAIIYLFLVNTDYTRIADREACHNSVVQRSASLMGVQPGQILPIRCKTQYITISSTSEQEIKSDIANAMYDCWWMLGEGKLDFFSEDLMQSFAIPEAGTVKSSCVICSIIKFDDKTKNAIREFDIMEYLKETKIPGKDMTYFEYFSDQSDKSLATGFEAPKITTDKDYSITFMGIRGTNYWSVLTKDLGVVLGSGYLVSQIPGGKTILSKGAGLLIKNPYVALIAGTVIFGTQGIVTAENNAIVAGKCNGEWEGCSNLILSQMTASELATTCTNIESLP